VTTALGSFAILAYAIVVSFTQENDFLANGFSWKSIVVRSSNENTNDMTSCEA